MHIRGSFQNYFVNEARKSILLYYKVLKCDNVALILKKNVSRLLTEICQWEV